MARVFERERTFADRIFRPIERLIYRLTGVDETREMRGPSMRSSMLLFSLVTMLLTYAVERLQHAIPLNPQHLAACGAGSCVEHGGVVYDEHELAVVRARDDDELSDPDVRAGDHNFFSAAVGMALAVALIRGISRRESKTLGNFWVDMTRASLWVLAAGLPGLCAGAGVAGRGAELPPVRSRRRWCSRRL